MDAETRELLQRGVAAIERLADEPEIQMETFPPVCPHCEMMNPVIRVEDKADEGPLGATLVIGVCMNCMKQLYAVPFQWVVVKTISEAADVVKERAVQGGYSSDD